jgi:hypothetical protein
MLALVAGAAHAQPVVDGSLVGDNYGSVLWVQNQPTTFGDNIAGAGSAPGNPGDVATGFEMTFPLSAIGYTGGPIKLGGFIVSGSGDFLSNQVFGDNAVNQGNFGNPRGLNFGTVAGDQFLTLNPLVVAGVPTLDGTAEASFWGGNRVWVNTVPTGFGDASTTNVGTSNGSELANLYAVISQNGTPGDASDDLLCLFVGGNLESNGNKLALFFDTNDSAGQNRILSAPPNPDWGNGFTRRIGDLDGSTPNGLTWDAAFAPETIAFFNTSGGRLFLDFVNLTTPSAGYLGLTSPLAQTYAEAMDGGDALPAITIRFNNSNNAGLAGLGGPGGALTPNIDIAVGSEIDAVWGYVDPSTNLAHIMITGNLENNYNKLSLFLDINAAEGQNQLIGTNLDVSIDNRLNRLGNGGNGAVGAGQGLRFDADFNADYAIFYGCGGSGPVSHFMDLATVRTNGPIFNSGFVLDYVSFDGGDKPGNRVIDFPATFAQYQDFSRTKLETNGEPASITAWASTQPAPVPGPDYVPPAIFANRVLAAFDNNNIAGVTSTSGTGGEAVTTGFELTIDLNSIGWDGTSPVKLAGFISSDNFATTSNQVLGGSNSAADLGEPSAIDFSAISGNQYVVIPVGVPGGGDLCNYDYNQDENVDLTDAQQMAQVAAGIITADPSWLSGDLNGDENADLTDAQQLAQFVASGVCPV